MKLRLGTRSSALATARSQEVATWLREAGHEVEVLPLTADAQDASEMPNRPSALGEFAGELRVALRNYQCDLVVHSYKDIPLGQESAPGLTFAAVPMRNDHREALVSLHDLPLTALPQQSRVGTSSLRRIAQLRQQRPDLTIVDVAGTLEERMQRVAPGDLDAVIFSVAGLARLGEEDRISEVLDFLPAPAQGAMVLECRSADKELIAALAELDDLETRICCTAEREVLSAMGVGYTAPIGAYAGRHGVLSLKAGAYTTEGDRSIVLEIGMPTSMFHAARTGDSLAYELQERGAAEFCNPEAIAASGVAFSHDEENMALGTKRAGTKVLLPRQEGRLSATLRDSGLVVDCVALQQAELISADNILAWGDWVVLPSAQTVWALRERGWRIPEGRKIACMGDTTRSAVEQAGREVDLCPPGTASSEKLIAMFPEGTERVVIPCVNDLSTKLEDGLRAKGYEVERLPVYRMADVAAVPEAVLRAWRDDYWDAVLLSHPSLAGAYVRLLGNRDRVKVLAWDSATAAALVEQGVVPSAISPSKDEQGIAALAAYLKV